MKMVSIHQIQDEIIREFSGFHGDMEMMLCHILKLGQQLPPMPEIYKTNEHMIKGCQSKVWLAATIENEQVYFSADSNTVITKGLISLLIRVFNGQPPDIIANADLYFIQQNGMDRFIGTHRSHGLAAMIRHMKCSALALKAETQVDP